MRPVVYSANLWHCQKRGMKFVAMGTYTHSSVSMIHHVGSESNFTAVRGSESLATREPQGLVVN